MLSQLFHCLQTAQTYDPIKAFGEPIHDADLAAALTVSEIGGLHAGIGVRTAARILLEIGDASVVVTSGHLAAYAGIAHLPGPTPLRRALRHAPQPHPLPASPARLRSHRAASPKPAWN